MLEVPEQLADDASVAVAMAGDAQVLVERNSHGLGFDDPYMDFSVAAHSLRVIGTLHAWARDVGVQRPEYREAIRIVLHGGGRVGFHEVDEPTLVSLIRRDQPWVERTVPKIGEHERDFAAEMQLDRGEDPLVPEGKRGVASSTSVATPNVAAPSVASDVTTIKAVEVIDVDDELTVQGVRYALIPVLELQPAERVYGTLFGMRIEQRVRQEANGWEELGPDYDYRDAADADNEADLVFMGNGPLRIVLQRAGRATRLDYSRASAEIGIAVDARTAARIKANVLMRGMTMLNSTETAFAFRDPFGVVWDVLPTP